MIYGRISDPVTLDPVGDSYRDWTPQVDDPQWAAYLGKLADAADRRRADLGAEVLAQVPQWAREALGEPPEDEAARAKWMNRAAVVAAHRELTGHDDPASAIGAVPKPNQVEAYASWRAAWRALGRPEADRDELELSDGQLRMRLRAYQREEAWSPKYVAEELAGTRQAIDTHRAAATLRQAEADAAQDAAERDRLSREAQEAAALAGTLDQRATDLEQVDQARGEWLAHTAETRAAADRAQFELSARRSEDGREEQQVTAEEWLADHEAATQSGGPLPGDHRRARPRRRGRSGGQRRTRSGSPVRDGSRGRR